MGIQHVIYYNAGNPIILLHNFYGNSYDKGTGERPTPSKAYTKKECIDISTKQIDDMLKAYFRITEKKEFRDFANNKGRVKRFPVPLTAPVLPVYRLTHGNDLSEFYYIADLF